MKTEINPINQRDAFGNALIRMARKHKNIVAIGADSTKSMGFSQLEKEFPERSINIGIGEQNMAMAAAGAASCGAKAFAATYAPFAAMRILEQIRTFIAYPNLDVKIISGLAGLSGGVEGVAHQGTEDLGIMRSIPNMVVAVPADAASTEVITEAITGYVGPVYLRIGRTPVEKVFDANYTFTIGKANILRAKGDDAAVIVNGPVVGRVLRAADMLAAKGIGVRVIEMPCVKPIDEEAIIAAAEATNLIITVEENNILAGLGGAVAEVLGEKRPTRIKRIGLDDSYAESATHFELQDAYGFRPEDLAGSMEQFINAYAGNVLS